MQKKILINLLIVSLCGIVLTTVVLYAFQTGIARRNASETFSVHLNNVVKRIEQNELQVNELTQATKEDYISRARALAMMIELYPGIIEDRDKLNEVVTALNVDEVHIIDENGILCWGSQPQYYGLDFAATDQTRPFLAILDDPTLEIAQDPMPNGSAGLMRQYACVSLRNAKGIAQIGVVPERLAEALKNNQICNVLSDIIVGNTGYIFSISTDNGAISSHPNERLVGALLPEPLQDSGFMTIDGQKVIYKTLNMQDHILVAVIPTAELYAQRSSYTTIFMGFLIVLFGAFCFIVNSYIQISVVNGISDTVNTLDTISAGNLDVTADVRTSTEFERLSDGINHMLQGIKTRMAEIAALAGDLRRFGAIVAIADAGIIVKDKDGIVLEWNIGAETIIGFKPEEIIGKSTKAYAPEEAHAGIDEIEKRLQNGEHITHLDVLRKHKDGHLIHCSASYTPIFADDGSFAGSVAIFHDISDKKQIEQALQDAVLAAEQANNAKSSFLANMSHEIRTPLNGIIGFAELATDDENIPEKTRDYLKKIIVSGSGLLKIINDILDISKIEAGKMELEKTPFSIHDVLEICETISSPKADEKGVGLYFYAEPPVAKNLLGDPTKLRQVLLNLLTNAIKFTNKGMVKLLTAIEETNDDNIVIHFEVKDNGIGMTPEQIQKIFEPFTQADSSTTRQYGGTGLGLAITKNIIELMGGELRVESTKGVGTKFCFTLTFETAGPLDNTPDSSEKLISEHQRPRFKGEILVCEDNAINQQVIQGHLARTGLTVTIVENGSLAVEAVKNKKEKPYDLIFMDIHMPVMDGLEASQRLMNMGNKSPVIALTANAMSKDKETYLQNGMSDYLAKPFVARELWACLLKFLEPVEMIDLTVSDTAAPRLSALKTDAGKVVVIDRQSGIEQSGEDEELYNQLLVRFARDNEYTYNEIKSAIDTGEIRLAHHMAHTLKGVSGTLGAIKLQKAASTVENALADGRFAVTDEQMKDLEIHLNEVLAELAPFIKRNPVSEQQAGVLDKEKATELIDELVPMLQAYSMQSLELLPAVKAVLLPIGEKAEVLISQMEDCDFELALETAQQIQRLL